MLLFNLFLFNIASSLDIARLVNLQTNINKEGGLLPNIPLIGGLLSPPANSYNTAFKQVKLTYYWITRELDYPTGGEQVTLKECNEDRAYTGTLSEAFYQSLHLEGSGELRNGVILNCFNSDCTCFDKVPGPMGTWQNILEPYISIAANDIPHNTTIYIKELDGVKLPSGQVHNGCARIDDTSYSFKDNHIDLFSFYRTNYETIQKKFSKESVNILVNANCKLLKYSR